MREDSIVAEIRRIREEYAEKYNFDIAAIVRAASEREQASGRKIVTLPPGGPARLSRLRMEYRISAGPTLRTWSQLRRAIEPAIAAALPRQPLQ